MGGRIEAEHTHGVLVIKVATGTSAPELSAFMARLRTAVVRARAVGPLRVLWDNRAGIPLPPETNEAIRSLLIMPAGSGERVAILVPDSSAKVKARPKLTGTTALFVSEAAALTWLSVGMSAAA